MYLYNSTLKKPHPFLYRISYDPTAFAIEFGINPWCIPLFNEIHPNSLILEYCKTIGFINPELDIQKNFGFNNCAVNKGIIDDLLILSFPLKAPFTLSENTCASCEGKKVRWDTPCYNCRGTGFEFTERSNRSSICATLSVLTRRFNWGCFGEKENPIPDNKWGQQHVFLEVEAIAGIGGECSPYFFEQLSQIPDEVKESWRNDMFDLYGMTEGRHTFPEYKITYREFEFRCEIGKKGRFYVEVPGQNGCSIHMSHHTDSREFSCHNIDTTQQQLCLLAGFASMAGNVKQI